MTEFDRSHQHIADHSNDGLLVLSKELTPLLINQTARQYLSEPESLNDIFKHLIIYTQKRKHILFNLKEWIFSQSLTNKHSCTETSLLWIKTDHQKALIPVIFKLSKIENSSPPSSNWLLLIQDQSSKIEAEAKICLIKNSSAGQFITDSTGLITEPNPTFMCYTGLDSKALQKMTYIDWLKAHVILKVPFDLVMNALLKTGTWSGKIQLIPAPQNSSSQKDMPAILTLSMLTDENRNIEHFIGVIQDLSEIHEAHHKIEQLAYYDALTGLANRTLLHKRLEQILSKTQNHPSYSALILLDLDNFKIINDTLGYATGDELLILVAQKLQKLTHQDNLVVRMEGDEFAVLFQNISQDTSEALTQALGLAYKIQDALDGRYTLENRSLHCSVSVGVYLFNKPPQEGYSDEIIRYTNMAMHEAKTLGGNQVYLFEDRLCNLAKQRLEMLQALNHSELDDEFQLYFQAQVNAQGQIVSAEALLRWFHPTLGFVPPSEFIPVAEEGRQIIKIGLWVMHKAFVQAKLWHKQHNNLRVAINISPVQFHEQSFIELIIGLVKFTQVNPAYITLELTEGVLIRNTTLALQKIQHLVSLGFHISIDDFGTGYSSLSYLQKLPIHELKIDRSFIQHIPDNQDDIAIVDTILKLAQNKQLTVVAEGVETERQANFLRQQSDTLLIQGYFFSKPAPAKQFEQQFLNGTNNHPQSTPLNKLSSQLPTPSITIN
jgi:diguanylate cyclase (GGDEF)-like protein